MAQNATSCATDLQNVQQTPLQNIIQSLQKTKENYFSLSIDNLATSNVDLGEFLSALSNNNTISYFSLSADWTKESIKKLDLLDKIFNNLSEKAHFNISIEQNNSAKEKIELKNLHDLAFAIVKKVCACRKIISIYFSSEAFNIWSADTKDLSEYKALAKLHPNKHIHLWNITDEKLITDAKSWDENQRVEFARTHLLMAKPHFPEGSNRI